MYKPFLFFRIGELYSHDMCSKFCQDRGCGKVYVCDGHWKTAYPICMFTGHETIEDYLPCVCVESPVSGKNCVVVGKKESSH